MCLVPMMPDCGYGVRLLPPDFEPVVAALKPVGHAAANGQVPLVMSLLPAEAAFDPAGAEQAPDVRSLHFVVRSRRGRLSSRQSAWPAPAFLRVGFSDRLFVPPEE